MRQVVIFGDIELYAEAFRRGGSYATDPAPYAYAGASKYWFELALDSSCASFGP